MFHFTPVVSCGWLAPPDNGVKEGIRYLKDSKVYFHCNNGHSLVGTEISTCLASGKWSSPTPTCQPGEDTQSTSPSAAQPGLAPPTCLPLPHPPPSARQASLLKLTCPPSGPGLRSPLSPTLQGEATPCC